MRILLKISIFSFIVSIILVICYRNFIGKRRELTTKRMVIITIEFPVLNRRHLHAYVRESRAMEKEERPAGSARSKFHFNPEIPRHIMATLLSLSFRLSLPLSLFISSSFFSRYAAPRAIMDASDAKAGRESETRTRDRVGIQRRRTRVSVIVIWMLIG